MLHTTGAHHGPPAIAALDPDLAPYEGEPVEHLVIDMFHIGADPADAMITAAAATTAG